MNTLLDEEQWKTTFPETAVFAMIPKQVIGVCSDRALRVYAALAIYKNSKSKKCTPSIKTLARVLRVHESTIKRGLEELCLLGLIKKEMRLTKHGGRTSNSYELLEPWCNEEQACEPIAELEDTSKDAQSSCSSLAYKQEETNKKNINNTHNESEELFNAVCKATTTDVKSLPKGQRKTIERIVKELQTVGATPSDVSARAKAMGAAWSSGKVTPKSLLLHWAEFAPLKIASDTKYGYVEKEDDFLWDEEQGAVIPINKL